MAGDRGLVPFAGIVSLGIGDTMVRFYTPTKKNSHLKSTLKIEANYVWEGKGAEVDTLDKCEVVRSSKLQVLLKNCAT